MFQTSVSYVYVGNADRCHFIRDRSEHYATGHALLHALFGGSRVYCLSGAMRPKNVARSGSHNIWLNTTVPSNYAGTRITNLINQNSTLKFTQKS